MNFLKTIVKSSGNEYASIANDGLEADVGGFIDTGSYSFNALVSGSLKGGIPDNKILGIAGESATGKTYFALGIASQFLKDNKDGAILYFDSEQAVTSSMIAERGLDKNRVAVFPVATVEQFRYQVLQIIENYSKLDKAEQKPMMIVLDSLGMLSTSKEMNDSTEGKEVRDMTRSQVIKSVFRTVTLKLGKHNIPMIVTNHTYDVVGAYVPTKEMGGGCLVSGTLVKTEVGDVPIEDVRVGDRVVTLFGLRGVTDTFKFNDKELYRIEFEDGTVIECSADHRFMIEGEDGYEWIVAKDITQGIPLVEVDSNIHRGEYSLCSTTANTQNGTST